MKLFCMDLHISVIADLKNIVADADAGVEIVDWCLSGHASVMGRQQEYPEIINPMTWKHLDEAMITAFQQRYTDFLGQFDGFIVGYTSAFAMIYEPYDKPVLMLNAVRYDIPFCWNHNRYMRARYHECLHRLHSQGRLTILSNNRADQAYTRLGCGIHPEYVPSLCLYAGIRYKPARDTFFCYGWSCQEPLPDHPLITRRTGHFTWEELGSYKGIIVFPYEASTMSMFEHFSGGLPQFFPSKAFLRQSHQLWCNSAYWKDDLPDELKPCADMDFWIDRADMYTAFQSPNTFYFDSVPHLFELLETFQYTDDTLLRKSHIDHAKQAWKARFTATFGTKH